MNLPPKSVDRVRESITDQFRRTRMQRLRVLEVEGREVLIRAQAAIRDCKEHANRVRAMIDEIRQTEETTVRLPILPPRVNET